MIKTYQNINRWSKHKQASEEIKQELSELKAILQGSIDGTGSRDLSYGEFARLTELADYIDPSDIDLLQAAGIPEYEEA